MRVLTIPRPFAGGYRSDAPDYAINPNESAWALDLIYPRGLAHQRWGWEYDGTSKVHATYTPDGVARAKHPYPDQTRTAVSARRSDGGGDYTYFYLHNSNSTGTLLHTGNDNIVFLPRCVYNGDVIWCAQDGENPLRRWGGSALSADPIAIGTNWRVGNKESHLEGDGSGGQFSLDWNLYVEKGAFVSAQFPKTTAGYSQNPVMCFRMLADDPGTTSVKNYIPLEGMRNFNLGADSAVVTSSIYLSSFGVTFPAVSVHDTGTISRTSSVANTSSVWTAAEGQLGQSMAPAFMSNPVTSDALLVLNNTNGSPHRMASVSTVDTATGVISVMAELDTQTNAKYHIMRRCPFKDATVHKNAFVGTGVKQYPNRVYVAPPGWNMSIPPGSVEPFDPVASCGYSNSSVTGFVDEADFMLSFYDVPSIYDNDPVVAVLPSPGPLLVLKQDSVYGMFGAWPSFDIQMLAEGAGCIDLRSAVTVNGVAYWAGKEGVYSYRGNRIEDLTKGRINREWRALMAGYVTGTSAVACGVVGNHLVVSVTGLTSTATADAKVGGDSAAPTDRTYCYDLVTNTWTSRFTNWPAKFMWSNQVAGEADALLSLSDTYLGYVLDGAPMVTGRKVDTSTNPRSTQTIAAASVTDAGSSSYPRMKAWTGAGLAQSLGIEGDARFMDFTVHTNLTDTSTPTTTMTFSTTHRGALVNRTTIQTKSLGTVTATTDDFPLRTKYAVNRTGRLHQAKVEVGTVDSTNTKTEVPEFVMTFRDSRRTT